MDGGVMETGSGAEVVFVAGSSRGIGKAIARKLLERGARVVLSGRDEDALRTAEAALAAEAGAGRVLAVAGDLTDQEAIAGALRQCLETFGRVDHLVANLGTGSGKPGWDQPEQEWERLFRLNFLGPVRLAQCFLPQLLLRRGSLLFIASIVALEATAAPLPYSAAKAALVNYSKNLARQLGPEGVRVNSLAPGNIFFEGGSWARHMEARPEAVKAMLASEVPLRRFGMPEEVASLAAWLCSQEAGFATGGCYVVDGGQTRSV